MVEKRSKDADSTSSSATKSATESASPTVFFNEHAIRNNFIVLEYSRTCQAAAAGIASGILGLNGTYGFLFYFLCIMLQALCWEYKAGFQWNKFFMDRTLSVTHSIIGGLFTYVLFWVFIYGIVHVY